MTRLSSTAPKPHTRAKKKSPATSPPMPDTVNRPGGKLGLILDRLERKTGATVDELVDATGWQAHSVRGALSQLRTRGFDIGLVTTKGRKAYRLAQTEA